MMDGFGPPPDFTFRGEDFAGSSEEARDHEAARNGATIAAEVQRSLVVRLILAQAWLDHQEAIEELSTVDATQAAEVIKLQAKLNLYQQMRTTIRAALSQGNEASQRLIDAHRQARDDMLRI